MPTTSRSDDAAPTGGFTIGYAKEKGAFRVYIAFVLFAVFGCLWFFTGQGIAMALAVFFGATAYYFYPLIETGKVRLGAGEYGMFIEGLGIIPWSAIRDIRLSTYAIRTITINELHIELAKALPKALAADWRSMPYYRLLMKVPWSMDRRNVIRINLEPLAGRPDAILSGLVRTRSYFGN